MNWFCQLSECGKHFTSITCLDFLFSHTTLYVAIWFKLQKQHSLCTYSFWTARSLVNMYVMAGVRAGNQMNVYFFMCIYTVQTEKYFPKTFRTCEVNWNWCLIRCLNSALKNQNSTITSVVMSEKPNHYDYYLELVGQRCSHSSSDYHFISALSLSTLFCQVLW